MSECTSIILISKRKGRNFFSQIKYKHLKRNFIKKNVNKLKAFKLIPIIYDEIGKRTFGKYIKRHGNTEEIRKYWDGFVLCKKIQRNNFLINRPGIINQTLELTRSFKTKKEVAQILFDYEIDGDKITLNLFLYRWENALIESLIESKTYIQFKKDINDNSENIKKILSEIFKESDDEIKDE